MIWPFSWNGASVGASSSPPPHAQRGPRYRQLPLWRDANRLLLEIEVAVRGFSRYHKYTLGTDLRALSMRVCGLVARAAQTPDPIARLGCVEQWVWCVEDIKIQVQLGKEIAAFASFAQFQRIAELSVALGKQSGGWWKRARSVAVAPAPVGATA